MVDVPTSASEPTTAEPGRVELENEREYVDALYTRLDELREEKTEQLAKVRRMGAIGSLQNQSERDAYATMHEDRLAQLNAVEERLVFGRLDLDGAAVGATTVETEDDDDGVGATRYIGRIGLTDGEQRRLLIDWRAPEAGAFYQATAFERLGVRRRRHLILRGRHVASLEDDVLDETLLDEVEVHQGEGALLAALTQRRTGRMGDIVSTIQAEQDRIIRTDMAGVVVVQGGPGTGKTAVALHRAAYLLYEHRERLKSAGVLLVGPSHAFMRYIERVLPSLGETGVVMSSLGELMPGIDAGEELSHDVARIKGDLRMAQAVKRAVANRQRLLAEDRRVVVEGTNLTLTCKQVKRARDKARSTGKPHNEARATFVKILVRELAEQLQEQLEESSGGGNKADRAYLVEDVRSSEDVRIALNLCWLPVTPQRLVSELLSNPEHLVAAAPHLSAQETLALLRPADAAWTESDVPLLDEAAELLGELDPSAGRAEAQAAAQRKRDLELAEKSVQSTDEMLAEYGQDGLVTAEEILDFNEEQGPSYTAAERAMSDRTWAYGHVVVDEAQELSPMQWRLLMRRCPMKSFTVVGDIAQASSATSTTSWSSALAPFVGDRFQLEELTVNYRTPTQIAEAAARVAQRAGLTVSTPKAVREGAWPPIVDHVQGSVVDALRRVLPEEVEASDGGLTAVIAPRDLLDAVRAVAVELFGRRVGTGSGGVEQDIVVTTAREAKGLEFDVVVLVEPEALIAEAGGGLGDLYVAMTRATQRLRVLAAGTVPDGLEG
ncbi:HelD family protein [Zhihengliuella halotolerans]|uniref:DNA helicase IV n=1 Tax=Zhihengliuella halotolerans TaxID=370736 RepID=A0A4Q8AC93_9MICC|nr:UvrD-helicase domain-containing protein [Zhihengliuella halotolerans]RZU61820.1 DNA helicase IV [Zhihengliuella halotolerans]